MKTGRLLDILSGHEGPVHGLAFSPTNVSTSDMSFNGKQYEKCFNLRIYLNTFHISQINFIKLFVIGNISFIIMGQDSSIVGCI